MYWSSWSNLNTGECKASSDFGLLYRSEDSVAQVVDDASNNSTKETRRLHTDTEKCKLLTTKAAQASISSLVKGV